MARPTASHPAVTAMPAAARAPAGEAGGATVELVLATPALLLLVMLIVQFALWQHAVHVAEAAAQEGARAARLEGGTREAGQRRAEAFLAALGPGVLAHPRVTAYRDRQTARVEVRGEAVTLVPGVRLPVRAASHAPVERFRPAAEPPP